MSGDVHVRFCERLGGQFPGATRLVLLDDDRTRLADWRELVRERLAMERLHLHPCKAHIYQTRRGVSLLGYLVFPNHRRLRNDNGHRFSRRLRGFARAYARGLITFSEIDPSVRSWLGHARHADTRGLRRAILSRIVFRRGTGREAAGVCCAGGEQGPLVQWTNAAERTASRDARLGGRPRTVHCSTNRRTSARPTATGTTPTTGTTTSVSVSPSPPARP